MADERGHVFEAGAQRRNREADDVEAIAEIATKASRLDLAGQGPIRGRDNARVDAAHMRLPEPPDLVFLEYAEQLGLNGRGQLGHLVEEERAAARLFEKPRAFGNGTRVGAASVAEQLGLGQLVR